MGRDSNDLSEYYIRWDTLDLVSLLTGFQNEVDIAMLTGRLREDDDIILDSEQQAKLVEMYCKHIVSIQLILDKRGVVRNRRVTLF